MSLKHCVFFDRDGIVNVSPGPGPGPDRYVRQWSEFRLQPAFLDALRVVRRRGYEAAIVTNQRGIATGELERAAVDDIHRRLLLRLQADGLALLEIAVCPHEAGCCECRKPAPGLLLDLARRHGIDLAASWMVGDAETDVEAGHRAGCRAVLVNGTPGPSAAEWRLDSMAALPALLERVL